MRDFFRPWCLLGPSASSSSSNPVTNDTQASQQGASGANSPTTTVTAGESVNYNDPALQEDTVSALAAIVQQAIQGTNQVSASVAQIGAQNQDQTSGTIDQVLSAEQAIAGYNATGGGLQTSQNTTYLIYGAIVIAVIAVLAFLFKKS